LGITDRKSRTNRLDVVVEISLATVNRLLATVNQKGDGPNKSNDPKESFKFPHSLVAQVGDIPKFPQFEIAEFFLRAYFGADILRSRDSPRKHERMKTPPDPWTSPSPWLVHTLSCSLETTVFTAPPRRSQEA
jgi:hypothetical protein